jgi:hypothetical protein
MQLVQSSAHLVSESALDPVADDSRPDRFAHDETDLRGTVVTAIEKVHDQQGAAAAYAGAQRSPEVIGSPEPMDSGEHERLTEAGVCRSGRRRCQATSGSEPVATLAAAAGQDGAAGARAHAQSEAVRLAALTVVRLEGALAHGSDPPGSI